MRIIYVFFATPAFANILIEDLYTSGEVYNESDVGLFAQNAFTKMNDEGLAAKLIADAEVPEKFITSLCGNPHLSAETRVAAYNRGINCFALADIPKEIVKELYENAVYALFNVDLKKEMNAIQLEKTIAEIKELLGMLTGRDLLSGGQMKDLFNMSKEQPIRVDLICAVAANAKEENLLWDVYKFSKSLTQSNKNEVWKALADNENIAEKVSTPLVLNIFNTIKSGNRTELTFTLIASFSKMIKRCSFDKEILDVLNAIDVHTLDNYENDTYLLCCAMENKEFPEALLDKFEKSNKQDIKMKARLVKELRRDERFNVFYKEHGGLGNIIEIFPHIDEFRDNIKRIYAEDALKSSWDSDGARRDFLKVSEQMLAIAGIKEPTKDFLENKIHHFVNVISTPSSIMLREASQYMFYERLNDVVGVLKYFNDLLKTVKEKEKSMPTPEKGECVGL